MSHNVLYETYSYQGFRGRGSPKMLPDEPAIYACRRLSRHGESEALLNVFDDTFFCRFARCLDGKPVALRKTRRVVALCAKGS